MKSKLSKKEILQLVEDDEQYQLYVRSKGPKSNKKKKQDSPNTKWDIVLLVFVVIIIYFILYKVIMIVIEIKIVNENAQSSMKQAIQRYNVIKTDVKEVNPINNNNQQIPQTQNIINSFNKQNQQRQAVSQNSKVQGPLISKQQIQKLSNQQKLKMQQQQLLAKLRQNMLQQAKIQKGIQETFEKKNSLQGSSQNHPASSSIKNNQQNPIKPSSQIKADQSKTSQSPKPQVTVNRAGISSNTLSMGVKLINLKNLPKQDPLADTQRRYYQEKYHISKYTKEIPFCVVVPSFNNVAGNRYLNNINSILQQEYQNYHIVFIDDASTDQTFNKLDEYLKKKEIPQGKIKMIKNQKQMFAMYNLRKSAMEYCGPQQIFMIVDGDDQLLGRQVFKFFNAIFQEKKAYFVYTNFITVRGSMGYSRQFPQKTKKDNSYRSYPFVTSHLRAYYTKLFQLIDEKDLKDDKGEYYRAANDVAICIPILQMAHTRVQYIPQVSYIYNAATGLNNHKLRLSQQKSNDRKIRAKKKYAQIKDLFQIDKQKLATQDTLSKEQTTSQIIKKQQTPKR